MLDKSGSLSTRNKNFKGQKNGLATIPGRN